MNNLPGADDGGCVGYAFVTYWFSLPVTSLIILQKFGFIVNNNDFRFISILTDGIYFAAFTYKKSPKQDTANVISEWALVVKQNLQLNVFL